MEPLPADRPLAARRRLAWAGAGIAAFALAAVLSRFPGVIEGLWGRALGPWIGWALSRVTGPLPFALVEPLFALWLGHRAFLAARGVVDVFRGRRRRGNALLSAGLVAVRDAGVAVVLFYGLWGLGYARAPLEERLGWPAGEPVAHRVVADLAADLVEVANAEYRALHGTDDLGAPTPAGDPATLDAALEEGWRRACARLGWDGPIAREHGPAKRLVISPLLRRAGLSGFYCPFTGEANVNASVPGVSRPQVLAHEKAHQRAVNPEDEANFLGWLAAASAPDARARYSAAVFAQRQLLTVLLREDPHLVRELVGRRLPGVQRDVDDLRAYWKPATGRTGRLARRVNDAYLRSNRVEGGVASYGGSVDLMIAWARASGGPLRAEP